MKQLLCLTALLMLLVPQAATAQSPTAAPGAANTSRTTDAPKQEYLLKFTAKEVEGGRVINTREYVLHTRAGGDGNDFAQLKTGSRVPVSTGAQTGGSNPALINTQFTYVDVGINLQCGRIQIYGDRVSMGVKGEISSYDQTVSTPQPVIRQNQWDGSVTMPIGKTETIFSSDDVVSKRTLQVDLQVTPGH